MFKSLIVCSLPLLTHSSLLRGASMAPEVGLTEDEQIARLITGGSILEEKWTFPFSPPGLTYASVFSGDKSLWLCSKLQDHSDRYVAYFKLGPPGLLTIYHTTSSHWAEHLGAILMTKNSMAPGEVRVRADQSDHSAQTAVLPGGRVTYHYARTVGAFSVFTRGGPSAPVENLTDSQVMDLLNPRVFETEIPFYVEHSTSKYYGVDESGARYFGVKVDPEGQPLCWKVVSYRAAEGTPRVMDYTAYFKILENPRRLVIYRSSSKDWYSARHMAAMLLVRTLGGWDVPIEVRVKADLADHTSHVVHLNDGARVVYEPAEVDDGFQVIKVHLLRNKGRV